MWGGPRGPPFTFRRRVRIDEFVGLPWTATKKIVIVGWRVLAGIGIIVGWFMWGSREAPQKTRNEQQRRRRKGLMRNTAVSCFPSLSSSRKWKTARLKPILTQEREGPP
jgi:hypothetical protein